MNNTIRLSPLLWSSFSHHFFLEYYNAVCIVHFYSERCSRKSVYVFVPAPDTLQISLQRGAVGGVVNPLLCSVPLLFVTLFSLYPKLLANALQQFHDEACREGGKLQLEVFVVGRSRLETSQLSIHSLMRELTAGRAVNSDIFTL